MTNKKNFCVWGNTVACPEMHFLDFTSRLSLSFIFVF